VVDENEVVLQTTHICTVLSLRSVDKVWICEEANKSRDLWSHAVLGFKPSVWISFQDQPLEETSVKIEAFALLNGKIVIIDLRAELSFIRSAQL
jgi:hypothetical protein